MARKPRYFLPGVAAQVVQRGHNEEPVFFSDDDYRAYLDFLQKSAERYNCTIHAYVLLENQARMLVTPSDADGISRMMQYLGRYYVAYINRNRDSSGTLWEGRYRGSLVQDAYLLSCMRYIELTPVRLNILPDLSMQRWTSHYANAYGRPDSLIKPHIMYEKLGADPQARQQAYLDFCNAHIDKAFSHWICTSWRSGRPLGSQTFIQMIEKTLNCKVGNAKPGRPRKVELEPSTSSNYGGFLNYAFKEAER